LLILHYCLTSNNAENIILLFRQISGIIMHMNTNDDASVGLRQRKRRETRVALSEAAIRLTMLRGWKNVTVDDIASAANVSPRTFRNYFSTKAEAVAAGHLERMLRIAEDLRARPVTEPLWTAISNSVGAQFERPGRKGREVPAADAKRWTERVRFLFVEPAIRAEVLKATAAAQGELAKAVAERAGIRQPNELYPQVAAAIVSAVVGVVLERWLRDGPSGSVVPLMRKAFDLVSGGLPESKKRDK
jgi:AcrR family transcriptional regulator